jgi:electron transfer flavoprotein alpha subunit
VTPGQGHVTVVLVARDPNPLVDALALEGVDEIVHVPVGVDEPSSDDCIAALEAQIERHQPSVVLMGFTALGMAVGPAVAARQGCGFASDVVACSIVDGDLVARRELYGGKLEAELGFEPDKPVILLLRSTVWAAAVAAGAPTLTRSPDPEGLGAAGLRHVEFIEPPSGDLDITRADVVLAVGRGAGGREEIEVLERLAAKIGAVVGASRPVVDAGYVSQAHLVGQSGFTVKPKLYLALGISGASQHVAGMKGSDTIVAVNKDPRAPIFGFAHYGAVADLFEIADELEALW